MLVNEHRSECPVEMLAVEVYICVSWLVKCAVFFQCLDKVIERLTPAMAVTFIHRYLFLSDEATVLCAEESALPQTRSPKMHVIVIRSR